MPQPEKIQQLLAGDRAVSEGFLRDNGQVPLGIRSADMQGRLAGILTANPADGHRSRGGEKSPPKLRDQPGRHADQSALELRLG